MTGDFDNGTASIPANSYMDVKKAYYYTSSGIETITYTVYFNGNLLDTWTGTHVISP